MTTPPDIAAIRERALRATDGPWDYFGGTATFAVSSTSLRQRIVGCDVDCYNASMIPAGFRHEDNWRGRMGDKRTDVTTARAGFLNMEDAKFTAHARTDIPALCDEVERLTEFLGAAVKAGGAQIATIQGLRAENEALKVAVTAEWEAIVAASRAVAEIGGQWPPNVSLLIQDADAAKRKALSPQPVAQEKS